MKRYTFLTVMAIILALTISLPFAFAEDVVINSTIQSIETKLDKNGGEYTRAIVVLERKAGGMDYSKGVPVMAFGELSAELKKYKAGDTIKCVADSRMYQGRESFTLLSIGR